MSVNKAFGMPEGPLNNESVYPGSSSERQRKVSQNVAEASERQGLGSFLSEDAPVKLEIDLARDHAATVLQESSNQE